MPVFAYRALTASGQNVIGELEAANRDAAIENLQNGGLIPIEARLQARARQIKAAGRSGVKIADQNLTRFTRSLAMMLQAGETLERSLKIIRDDTTDRKLDQVLAGLIDRIRAGRSLSQAMAEEGNTFPRSYLSLVRAAEASGRLGDTLDDIARARERSEALRRKLMASLTYPILLLISALIAIAVLLVYVVPQFSGLFGNRLDQLPFMTRVVMTVSDFLSGHGIEFLIVLLLLALLLPRLLRVGSLRRSFERLLLGIPGVGALMRERVATQFSASLANLLRGGLDLPTALQMTRDALPLLTSADAVGSIEADVRQGVRFVDSVRAHRLLPSTALSLFETGEASGRLKETAAHLAELYEERLTSRLTQLVAIVEPALVIILGLVVGAIVMSILSAVLSLNELAL